MLVPKCRSYAKCLEMCPLVCEPCSCAIWIWLCVKPGLQAQRFRVPGSIPGLQSFSVSSCWERPFLTFWSCKMELLNWPQLVWCLLLHLLMRAVGDCYYQGATYFHWSNIGCIEERGRTGSVGWVCWWRVCLEWERFMWYPVSGCAKGYTTAQTISC